MGDSMVVLARSDFLRVSPTSLRRAASQLVANTLFTEYLGDVRGFPDKVSFLADIDCANVYFFGAVY